MSLQFTRAPLLLLTFFLLMIGTSSAISAPINLTELEVPQRAPTLELISIDKNVHTLSEYKGKPVIINFWATWCPPCVKELPAFNRAWSKVKDKGIEMIAVNVGDDPQTVIEFMKDIPIDFTVLLDPDSEQISGWQMHGLPSTFILNPNGEVAYQAVGEREWDNDELLAKVLALRISKH